MPNGVAEAIRKLIAAIDAIKDPKRKAELIAALEKLRDEINQELEELGKQFGPPGTPWVPIPPWIAKKKP